MIVCSEYKSIESALALFVIDMKPDLYVYDVQRTPDLDHGKTRTKKTRNKTLTAQPCGLIPAYNWPNRGPSQREIYFPSWRSIHAISFSSRSRSTT